MKNIPGIKFLSCVGIFLALVLAACSKQPETAYSPRYSEIPPSALREYVFGVYPLHNPERLQEMFGPIMDYLTEKIPGVRFRLEASRSYAIYEEKLYGQAFDFALANPYQTLNALKHGYQVFGKMADDEKFHGIILVRKDGPVHELPDLKGQSMSFPAQTALAATMLPQYFLHNHGLDVNRDIDCRYVGSQESAIMNVYLGNTVAGATWTLPWLVFSREHPSQAAELEIKWRTESLPNNGLLVRGDVSPDLTAQVKSLILTLHEQKQGEVWLARLALSRFEEASAMNYVPVRDFLSRFAKTVRPVPGH